jgi:hypothetical protein
VAYVHNKQRPYIQDINIVYKTNVRARTVYLVFVYKTMIYNSKIYNIVSSVVLYSTGANSSVGTKKRLIYSIMYIFQVKF